MEFIGSSVIASRNYRMALNAPSFIGIIRIAPLLDVAADRPWDDSSLELLLESLACRPPIDGDRLAAGRWTLRPRSSNTRKLQASLGAIIAELEAELAKHAGTKG
jgi:hypothetical protein